MIGLGVHVSIAGGLEKAVDRALDRGCGVFQILAIQEVGTLRSFLMKRVYSQEKLNASGLSLVVDHNHYLSNLASPKEDVYNRSVKTLTVELSQCQELGIPYFSDLLEQSFGHRQAGRTASGHLCYRGSVLQADNDVILLLENTPGSKNCMVSFFDEIAK
ncbi:MAG: hypothetical protein LUQ38_06115 [Methanotrichaceae archaeon]|nr:hypothetical protein [Methanotrichaceae archaeon]